MSDPSNRIGDLSPEAKRALLGHLLQKKASASNSLFPASYGQRALWFLWQLAPQSAAYNILYSARIRSGVDLAALRRAFQALADRHPILRTTYTRSLGKPVQQIHEQHQVHFEEVDASAWTWDYLNARLFEEADRPFDLERGPVLRVKLFARSPQAHVLVITIHHIAVDFWSLDLIVNELKTFYAADKTGAPALLPPLPAQYADYAHWQSQMLEAPEAERLWSYWQKQLGGELPALNLPTDRPRPPVQTYHGASHNIALSEGLTARLRALAKAEGTTLYVLLLAAFKALLHRYTAQDDILIGSPLAGRSRAELSRIVGYFINPVVLRSHLSGDPTFKTFLGQVRGTVLGALEHEDFPFPLLVERLQPKRDASRSPLFQVAFIWDKLPQPEEPGEPAARQDGRMLDLEPIAVGQRGAPFDLTLTVAEGSGSLTASFQYNTDLFDAERIVRMSGHLRTLLE
ncbi:MAG: non-ribosomal peptide synthetase, partial [Chloroflexi bacterium]|nr:non-ribosomal peptide synthetase [Chloroflexota bacterium]